MNIYVKSLHQPAVSRVYNSPAALYSEENLAAALQESGLKSAEAGHETQNRLLTSGASPVHSTADHNNKDVVDSSKFIPVAVTSNPVANGMNGGKQKVGTEVEKVLSNQTFYFRLQEAILP